MTRAELARAITLVESTRPDDEAAAEQLLASLPAGSAIRVGVTGAPGAGKSTFIDALGDWLIRERGLSVAVLAIDPSSTVSRGSLLGDKTRMARLAAHDRAFIRPSPSSGVLGGVGPRTRGAIALCEAAGYSVVIVETVGVGQSETAVASMVDFTLLLVLPGAGDLVQGLKRGLMEHVDGIGVTRADGDRALAEQTRAEYLAAVRASGRDVAATLCSGVSGEGIEAVWSAIEAKGPAARGEQAVAWMREAVEQIALRRIAQRPDLEAAVRAGRLSPVEAARQALSGS